MDLEKIRGEVAGRLKSVNKAAHFDKVMKFVPDESVVQILQKTNFLGKLQTCNKLEPRRQENSLCDKWTKDIDKSHGHYTNKSKVCYEDQAHYCDLNLTELFSDRRRWNVPFRSLEERSWSGVSVAASESSDSNNSMYSIDTMCSCTHTYCTMSEEKILNTCTHPASTNLKRISARFSSDVTVYQKKSLFGEYPYTALMDPRSKTFDLVDKFESIEHRSPCVISDVACFPDMSILVLDHYHNSIQMFGPDYQLLDYQTCEYPIGCTCINSEFVAVSLRRSGQLALFRKVDSKLQLVRKIKIQCNYYLWQTTYKSGRLFVVCDENEIHALDINGKEYFSVSSGIPTEGGYIRYFDVSDDGKFLYLSVKQGLRCISVDGEFKWLFGTNDLPKHDRNPQGHVLEDVCFHKSSLFCSQWISSKIYEISLDGIFLRNVVVSQIEHPRSIAVMGNCLLVSQFYPSMKPQSKRQIKVFNIAI